MAEPSEHVSTTEARAGATPHVTRYVLGVGLLLGCGSMPLDAACFTKPATTLSG